jgi:hypothetical protein
MDPDATILDPPTVINRPHRKPKVIRIIPALADKLRDASYQLTGALLEHVEPQDVLTEMADECLGPWLTRRLESIKQTRKGKK